ncbi:DNA polymerase III subunit beta [candidate division KSB1 bacterium]|nr:DNA polymerase III subunit beta [candidate division KSB1 bacterium]
MNFTISKSEFYEALHKVVGVVPQKTTISVLTCILLELEDNQLRLTGTDLEVSVTISLNVNGEENGSVAIPAKLLLEIVRELPDVPLNIFSGVGDKIVIKTEKGEYKISSQPKEDFPRINIEEGEVSFEIDSQLLSRMTNKTIFAVSNDELRPALTGINVELSPTEITFVGTDGHRLSRIISRKFKASNDVQLNIIVPTKALNLMLRILNSDEKVKVQVGEDHIQFEFVEAIIYSKLIAGTYPNYERVIPKDNDKKMQAQRELLVSTLRRVSIFSSTLTYQVRFVLEPKEITIHSEDIEFGAEGKESMPASFSDEWMQIGYNSNYLMDILRHIDDENVVFEVKDSSSAAIIYPEKQEKDEDLLMLIMPIRINEETEESEEAAEDETD